jgi:hypothetical protein
LPRQSARPAICWSISSDGFIDVTHYVESVLYLNRFFRTGKVFDRSVGGFRYWKRKAAKERLFPEKPKMASRPRSRRFKGRFGAEEFKKVVIELATHIETKEPSDRDVIKFEYRNRPQ